MIYYVLLVGAFWAIGVIIAIRILIADFVKVEGKKNAKELSDEGYDFAIVIGIMASWAIVISALLKLVTKRIYNRDE